MIYCGGCGRSYDITPGACVQCGSWEFTDKEGYDYLNSVGKIDSNLKPAGSSNSERETAAGKRFGSGRFYSGKTVKKMFGR